MQQSVDRRRSEREFQVGESVYLKLKPSHLRALLQNPSSKLNPRFYGLFPITVKVGNVAYRLQLPEGSNIHSVFHVALLNTSMGTQPTSPTLPCLPSANDSIEEPITVLDRRAIYRHEASIPQVLIKWSHLHSDSNTWEYLPDILRQFSRVSSLLHIS